MLDEEEVRRLVFARMKQPGGEEQILAGLPISLHQRAGLTPQRRPVHLSREGLGQVMAQQSLGPGRRIEEVAKESIVGTRHAAGHPSNSQAIPLSERARSAHRPRSETPRLARETPKAPAWKLAARPRI